MKTIKELYESINIEDLRTQDEFGQTDTQLLNVELYMIIWKKIKSSSKRIETKETRKGIVLSSSYFFEIQNEEVLKTLRQLYISSKNNFVKEVVKTVGQTKIMTEKQAEIIIEEIMKFNLTLNF